MSLVKLDSAARLGALSGVQTFTSIASGNILSVTSTAIALPTAISQLQGNLLPTTDLSALETSGFERSTGTVIVAREIAATTNATLPFNGMLEVLIIYVCNPPISDAVQGAYFAAAFFPGLFLGAGALVFRDITEGLGCLLGGFCLSMWLLVLKSGGIITSTAGKSIFIGVFCLASFAFSFSHYTRSYGIIGSTSFAGATAIVLGIDCFSRAGLKEFWLYIW
ncbi:MAG: hypothetical protein Q9187_004495, partial [Circinaria calcarea]